MNRDSDFIGLLEGYLDDVEGMTPLPDATRDAIRARLPSIQQRPAWWPGWRFPEMNTTMKFAMGTAAALAVVMVGVVALGGPGNIGAPQPSPSASPGRVCSPASPGLASAIATRLTAEPDEGMPIPGGVSLGDAWIVRSGDGEAMYFVGARIEGQGMENVGGVWLTDDPSGNGAIFAVSTRARQFSDWPDRADLEPTADGFYAADNCAHRPPRSQP